MGWYHSADFNWEGEGEGAPAACSVENKPKKNEVESHPTKKETSNASRNNETKVDSSGNTACLLPADSPPPPPPPDAECIYHLCQKKNWDEAMLSQQPYFPPTYMSDGKFTRATVHKRDILATANEFYKTTPGEWILLKIDCKMLFGLGIPILAQDAPESTEKQPVKCLQVFGGISTVLPGLIRSVYTMRRSKDGTFLKIISPPKEEEKKEEYAEKTTGRRFWPLKKKK